MTGNHRAFAAILSDEGKVVTWGDGESGGKSAAVQDQLRTGDAACYIDKREMVSCVNSFRGEEVIGQKRGYHGSILSIWEAGFKMN